MPIRRITISSPGLATGAFTLVEVLVSTVILLVIMAMLLGLTRQAATIYQGTNGKIESFESARNAFESMTRNLGLATLNNYYDYVDATGARLTDSNSATFIPANYAKVSDLHFFSGQAGFTNISPQVMGTHALFFQAPQGYSANTSYQRLGKLLNAYGYFIYYGTDQAPKTLPAPPVAKNRYQLMEFVQPSENLRVYSAYSVNQIDSSNSSETNWFNSDVNTFLTSSTVTDVHVLARNILCLVASPQLSPGDSVTTALTADYNYDSRGTTHATTQNLLPPIVSVTMIAVDETSALRLSQNATALTNLQTTLSTLFTTTTQMAQDLQTAKTALNNSRANYRVFQSEVALKGAKF